MNKTNLRSILFASCVAAAAVATQAQTKSNYVGPDNDNWNVPANWSPATVPNNSGVATFDVTIDNKTVNLDIDPTISSLKMPGDAPFLFSTDHNLTIGTTDEVAFGDIEFTADQQDVTCDLGNFKAFSNHRLDETAWFISVNAAAGRSATLRFNGADVVSNNGSPGFMGPGTTQITDENGQDAFRNMTRNESLGFFQVGPGAGSHYTVAKSATNEGLFPVFDGGTLTFAQNLTEVGDIRDPNDQQGGFMEAHSQSATTPSHVIVDGMLTNYNSSTKTLRHGRYNLETANDGIATFQVLGGTLFDIVNNDASIILVGPGAAILDANGTNALRNLATNNRFRLITHDFTTIGSLSSGTAGDKFGLLAIRGESNMTVSGDLNIVGGGLERSPLPGYDLNESPTNSQLTVQGNLNLESGSYCRFEVFGSAAPATVVVTGEAKLGGSLELFVIPNAPIASSGAVTLLTAHKISGAFSNAANGSRVLAYTPTEFLFKGQFDGVVAGTFRVTYNGNAVVIDDFQAHNSLLNLSTRVNVQMGDNVAISGFILGGMGPKKIILRGIGPSLSSRNVPGALADSILELHDAAGEIIMSNDDWQDTDAAAITATGLAPTDPRESAIVATLDPGIYTAILRGAHNTAGIGLVEVYDLDDQPAKADIANISTRGRVGIGDDVLIGGLIVGAMNPANVIVRAIGPSLTAHQIADPLQDPILEIHDASGMTVFANDDWQDDAASAAKIRAAGISPTDSRESALAVSLNAGNYTAIVRGKNTTQGVALVEFYKLN